MSAMSSKKIIIRTFFKGYFFHFTLEGERHVLIVSVCVDKTVMKTLHLSGEYVIIRASRGFI
jgi:hypothetical protein